MKAQLKDIEVNVVRQCNLQCIACNHGSPLAENEWMDIKVLEEDLDRLREFAHWEMCMLQGGEPTIRQDLWKFILAAKESYISDHVGVLTNGTLMRKQPQAFWETAQECQLELRVSIYPILPASEVDWIKEQCATWNIKFFANPPYTHFMKMFRRHEDGGKAVWDACPWKRCWTVHNGYLYCCPTSAFFPKQFPEMYSPPPAVAELDGYKIEHFTEATMDKILNRQDPLYTCAICVGHGTERVEWGQTRNREEWIKASTVAQ